MKQQQEENEDHLIMKRLEENQIKQQDPEVEKTYIIDDFEDPDELLASGLCSNELMGSQNKGGHM